MKFYRIEWDFDDYYGSFEEAIDDYKDWPSVPVLPHRPMKGENVDIPRIFLSDSIIGCINAIGAGTILNNIEDNIKVTNIYYLAILLHVYDIYPDDEKLITPTKLVEKGLVPDALENNEYWYLDSIKRTNLLPFFIGLESMTYEKPLEYYEQNNISVRATGINLISPKLAKVQDYRWSVRECMKIV